MMRFLIALVATAMFASLLTAHAADLRVDAGVLQTFTIDADIPVPVTTIQIHVELGEYLDESGAPGETRTLGPYELESGQQYFIEYDEQTRDCPASITTPNQQTGGPFTASTDLIHVLCVEQVDEGAVVIRADTVDGPVIAPSQGTP